MNLATIYDRLMAAERPCVLTHFNPDGDAMGSLLALFNYLEVTGRTVFACVPSSIPDNLLWLPRSEAVVVYDRSSSVPQGIANADLIVILDLNSWSRLGELAPIIQALEVPRLLIDHHPEAEIQADLTFTDTDSAATCELLSRLLSCNDESTYSTDVATCLYTGIMTDTGGFRFSRTHAGVHRIVARLIDSGADPAGITEKVWNQNTPQRLLLLGEVLQTISTHFDGSVATMYVTHAMLNSAGADYMDTDGFVQYVMGLRGVMVGILCIDRGDHVKVSFRSKGKINIRPLAKRFGGGGHDNAAGGRTESLTAAESITVVLDAIRDDVELIRALKEPC